MIVDEGTIFFLFMFFLIALVGVVLWNVINNGIFDWKVMLFLFIGMNLSFGISFVAAMVSVDDLLIFVMLNVARFVYLVGWVLFIASVVLWFKQAGEDAAIRANNPMENGGR